MNSVFESTKTPECHFPFCYGSFFCAIIKKKHHFTTNVTEFGIQRSDFVIRIPEFGIWNSEFGIRTPGSGTRSPVYLWATIKNNIGPPEGGPIILNTKSINYMYIYMYIA